MKSNIDLTEDQIFSRINFDSIINVISNKYFRVPWNIKINNSGDEYDLLHQKQSLIALGNKKQREEVKFYRKMDSRNYCECCGKRINLTPWNKEISKDINYQSLSEYLCEFIGASMPRNVVACAIDLAKFNHLTIGELFKKYEPVED